MAFVRQPISDGWRWRLSDSNGNETADSLPLREWRQVSSFPSVIYSELLHHGLIPDPNIGENERLVQWAGDADWEYSCLFRATSAVSRQACLELVFEGLDTFCTVWLNGSQILVSDNMFLPHRVDVRRLLKDENELRLVFESTPKKSTELEHRYGPRNGPMSIMRDPRANLVRKARVGQSIKNDKSAPSYICQCSLVLTVSLGLGLGSQIVDLWALHAYLS